MSLMKVLLVDDEYLVLKALKITIQWERLGCVVVGEAHDGAEALQLAQTLNVDIIVTDINMPKISGLELIKSLHSAKSTAKIIIISGYEKFEYAQEAIRYGVSDYLLKPLSDEKISDAVLIAKETIEAQQAQQESSFIKNCILGITISETQRLALRLSENCYFRLTIVRAIAADAMPAEMLQNVFASEMATIEKKYNVRCYTELFEQQLVLLLLCRDKYTMPSDEQYRNDLQQICSAAALQTMLVVGIGTVCNSFVLVRESYLSISHAIELALIKQEDTLIVQVPQGSSESLRDSEAMPALYLRYRDCLLSHNEVELKNVFAQLKQVFLAQPFQTAEDCRAMMLALSLNLQGIAEQMYTPEIATRYFAHMVYGKETPTLHEFFTLAEQRSCEAMLAAKHNAHTMYNSSVQTAVSYIEYHYCENFGLCELAELLHLTPSYLSTLFCKEVGEGVNGYINRKRIEKAKKLLRETRQKINEIALAVGYNSDKHFIATFRKYEQITPSEYRNSATCD